MDSSTLCHASERVESLFPDAKIRDSVLEAMKDMTLRELGWLFTREDDVLKAQLLLQQRLGTWLWRYFPNLVLLVLSLIFLALVIFFFTRLNGRIQALEEEQKKCFWCGLEDLNDDRLWTFSEVATRAAQKSKIKQMPQKPGTSKLANCMPRDSVRRFFMSLPVWVAIAASAAAIAFAVAAVRGQSHEGAAVVDD